MFPTLETLTMAKSNEQIIQQKERLAAEVLQVADDALQDIKVTMGEASVKDLLAIFNSAVKTHRDLMSDIVAIQDKETKEEEKLAKEYTGKVDELLKKISGGN
jgi:aminoglycoside/choline kinase family phosphotransferase